MGRLQAWTLASRARYALVWGGITAVTFCSIRVLARYPHISLGSVLSYGLVVMALTVVVRALWYPRAKRSLATRPG